jgi:hypothetical protein
VSAEEVRMKKRLSGARGSDQEIATQIIRVVQDALDSWPKTTRLCLLLLAIAVAAWIK